METRGSVAITVAWTVSVTTVLMCDIAAILAHAFVRSHPDARSIEFLGQWLLLSGSVIGIASLVLLPVVYRVRRVPPPTPLAAFAVCAAIAPLLAILVAAMR